MGDDAVERAGGAGGDGLGVVELELRRGGEALGEGLMALVEPARLAAAQGGRIDQIALGNAAHGAAQRDASGVGHHNPAAFGRQGNLIEPLRQRLRRRLGTCQIGGQRAGDRGLFEQRNRNTRRQAAQAEARLAQPHRLGLDLGAHHHAPVGIGQAGFGQHLVEQESFHRRIVLEVALVIAALGAVERRLGDVEMAALDQLRHLAEEECQQQCADMRAVDVGVRHDDDAVVAQLADIEAALFRLAPPDAGAHRGDERADFGRAQHAVEPRALDVEDLALQRQDRLVFAVSPLLGGAAGRVTLDDEEFAFRRVPLLAIRQLARQCRDIEHAFAPCQFAGLAGRLAGGGGVHHLLDDAFGFARVGFEPVADDVGHHRLHHRLHLGGDQLVLGLRGEFRVRHLDRQYCRHALAHVLADEGEIVLLAHPLGIFRHHARQRLAEPGEMGAAVALRDVVGEAQHRLMETVVPGQCEFDADFAACGGVLGDDADRRVQHRCLGAVEPIDEGHQPALVEEDALHRLGMALVAQHDGDARIEECEFPQPPLQDGELEFDLGEGAGRWLERHLGAGRLHRIAGDRQRGDGVAMFEADEMLLADAPDLDFHPLRQRIDHRRAHAVQPARDLVGVLVELAAGVQAGEHHFGGGDAFLVMDVGRDAAPVVAHRDGAVAVQGEGHLVGEPGLGFVDRVVDDLEGHVMQARAVIGVPDIHAGPLAHGIETAEHGDRRGVIRVGVGRGGIG